MHSPSDSRANPRLPSWLRMFYLIHTHACVRVYARLTDTTLSAEFFIHTPPYVSFILPINSLITTVVITNSANRNIDRIMYAIDSTLRHARKFMKCDVIVRNGKWNLNWQTEVTSATSFPGLRLIRLFKDTRRIIPIFLSRVSPNFMYQRFVCFKSTCHSVSFL